MEFTTLPKSFNLAHYVLHKAAKQPDKIALEVVGEPPLTYGELERAVLSTATGLTHATQYKTHRVLLRLGNTPLFPIAYLGAIAAGLIPIVTSSKLTQKEIDDIASETQPDLTLQDCDLVVPSGSKTISGSDIVGLQNNAPSNYHMGDGNRAAYIIYTSGTSGKPRAVEHAHRAVWARQSMFKGWYGLSAQDRVMHAGAFNWTYTLGTGLIDPWTVGATAIIPKEGTEATDLPMLIAQNRVTIFAAAPGVYRRMNRAQFPAMPKLRHGLSAGEKLPLETRENWQKKTGKPIYEAFGMSECSTFLSENPSKPAPIGSLGFPQAGRRIALLDDGKPADHGVLAIHKSDPGLMRGYLNQPEETAAKFNGDWFLTGDIGTRTPEGTIIYEGRADDMMNAGGTRVSPIEVETILNQCAKIDEAACAEVRLNNEISLIAAFYTAQEMIDEDHLTSELNEHLADYKVPRIFVRVPSLPRGNNNKLLRKKLRQDWEAAHGQT